MTTTIEYALMAGASYISTRSLDNQFPVPQGWTPFFPVPNNPDYPMFAGASGFEAVSFTNGSEIVISFAGTYPNSPADIAADFDFGIKGVSIAINFGQPCHAAHALN